MKICARSLSTGIDYSNGLVTGRACKLPLKHWTSKVLLFASFNLRLTRSSKEHKGVALFSIPVSPDIQNYCAYWAQEVGKVPSHSLQQSVGIWNLNWLMSWDARVSHSVVIEWSWAAHDSWCKSHACHSCYLPRRLGWRRLAQLWMHHRNARFVGYMALGLIVVWPRSLVTQGSEGESEL
jgi:hypothetical protein